MTRLWSEGTPISIQYNSNGFPVRFTWLERTYQIHRIQQRWQVQTDWWDEQGHVGREYIAITTTNGVLCVLYRELQTGEWYLSRIYD